jgi:AcrR family transcriptional regulator
MAKQMEGVYEKVFECAKQEFLEKGFKDASLRVIAKNAGTSTGSIYTRFQDKEGLFYAIVSPVVEEVTSWFHEVQENFHQQDAHWQKDKMVDYSVKGNEDLVSFIYDHFDVFKLLVEGAHGTVFADFLSDLVELEVDYTLKFLKSIGNDAIERGFVSKDFFHIVFSAYYNGMFEIIRHDMGREEGMLYVKQLREFYYAGFQTLVHPKHK